MNAVETPRPHRQLPPAPKLLTARVRTVGGGPLMLRESPESDAPLRAAVPDGADVTVLVRRIREPNAPETVEWWIVRHGDHEGFARAVGPNGERPLVPIRMAIRDKRLLLAERAVAPSPTLGADYVERGLEADAAGVDEQLVAVLAARATAFGAVRAHRRVICRTTMADPIYVVGAVGGDAVGTVQHAGPATTLWSVPPLSILLLELPGDVRGWVHARTITNDTTPRET